MWFWHPAYVKLQISYVRQQMVYEIYMTSRMGFENDHWQNNLMKTNFGWKKKLFWNVFMSMCDINLMPPVDITNTFLTYGWWSVDINCWHHFEVNSIFIWKMCALCLVLTDDLKHLESAWITSSQKGKKARNYLQQESLAWDSKFPCAGGHPTRHKTASKESVPVI